MVLPTFLGWLTREQTNRIKEELFSQAGVQDIICFKMLDSAEHSKNLPDFRYTAINHFREKKKIFMASSVD